MLFDFGWTVSIVLVVLKQFDLVPISWFDCLIPALVGLASAFGVRFAVHFLRNSR
jgi:hypothetical protein